MGDDHEAKYQQLLKNVGKDRAIYVLPKKWAENAEIITPHYVVQPPPIKAKQLPITRSERYERPKLEHILKRSSLEFFKLINEVMASRIDPPVEMSPSVKLVKQRLVKEQAESSQDNRGYKSLFGE